MKKRKTGMLFAALMLAAVLSACGNSTDVGGLGKDGNNTYGGNQQTTGDGGSQSEDKIEKSSLKLETYEGDGFSLMIPKGWTLETVGDGIYFGYTVSNPEDESMKFFHYGKLEPILKSEEARQSWKKWGPITGNGSGGEYFGYAPVCTEKTAKAVLEAWGQFVDFQRHIGQSSTFVPLNNISVKSCDSYQGVLAAAGMPETIALASCETASGRKAQISVSVALMDPGYQDLFMEGIDTYYMTAYELNGVLVPENCDEETVKTLFQCMSSLEFTEEFLNRARQQSDAALASVQQRSAENEALMDAFMRKWGYK